MRVAVFRALADGRRTAERLIALGHRPILAPVLEIVPTGATVPHGTAGVLVFTSAQAPIALARHALGDLRHRPCWCVGSRTAEAARAAGFIHVLTGAGDATSLAKHLVQSHEGIPVTLVAGRDRKADLEAGLWSHGIAVSNVEAYAAEAVAAWPTETLDALEDAEGALHYSRRSASLAYACAVAGGLERRFKEWRHHCLSEDVASPLRDRGLTGIEVSARPDEDHLLITLDGRRP